MLVEMRRAALLILVETLFGVDITAELDQIWQPVLAAIAYISPGAWLLWPSRFGLMPRPGYRQPLATLDAFLLRLIQERRQRETTATICLAGWWRLAISMTINSRPITHHAHCRPRYHHGAVGVVVVAAGKPPRKHAPGSVRG